MGKLINNLDLRGPPVGTLVERKPRKVTRLRKSSYESPAVKWVELLMLIAIGLFGAAGMAAILAKAGAPLLGLILVFGMIGFGIYAWCDVYVEEIDEPPPR